MVQIGVYLLRIKSSAFNEAFLKAWVGRNSHEVGEGGRSGKAEAMFISPKRKTWRERLAIPNSVPSHTQVVHSPWVDDVWWLGGRDLSN